MSVKDLDAVELLSLTLRFAEHLRAHGSEVLMPWAAQLESHHRELLDALGRSSPEPSPPHADSEAARVGREHDRIVRQMRHVLAAGALAKDPAVAEAATALEKGLFPGGYDFLRRGPIARAAAGRQAEAWAAQASADTLERFAGPDGTLLELHLARLAQVRALDHIWLEAHRPAPEPAPKARSVRKIRAQILRLFTLIRMQVDLDVDAEAQRALLLAPLTTTVRQKDEARARSRRRAARRKREEEG